MKRSLIVIAVAIIVAIGFLLIAPGFIDWSKRKPQITAQLHEATGFNFEIKGDLELALVPYPRVVIGGLEVSNPDYNNQKLLTLDKAEASLAVAPLFSGKVQVETVSLVKPDIALEIGPEGQKSWLTDKLVGDKTTQDKPQTGEGSEQAFSEAISWDAIKIKDGSFQFVDKEKEQSYQLTDLSALIKADTVKGPYDIEAEGQYNGQMIELEAETKKYQKDSLPLHLILSLPKSDSRLEFSGVVGFGKQPELQGQSSIKTAQIASFLSLAGMTPDSTSPYLSQPLQGQAMVTLSPSVLALHDLSFTYADIAANGKIVLSDRNVPSKPQSLSADLVAAKPVNLNSFMTGAASGDQGKESPAEASGKKTAPRQAFLPETLTLPANTTATLSVKAPAVQVAGMTAADVAFSLTYKERAATGSVKATLPGAKPSILNYSLTYEAASRSAREGTVTLSDPALSYQLSVESEQGAKTVAAFFKPTEIRPYLPLVQGGMKIGVEGGVTPHSMTVKSAAIDLSSADFLLSGEYRLKSGRDNLKAVIRSDNINLDPWLKVTSPSSSGGALAPASSEAGKEKTPGLDIALPFDLDLTLQGENVSWGRNKYDRIALLATLEDQTLSLKTLEVVADKGDKLLVSGTVKNIKQFEGINLAAEAQTQDIKATLSGFGVKGAGQLPEGLKAVRFVGSFKGRATELGFTANLSGMNGSLAVDGVVGDVLTKPVFSNLTVRLKHPNYTELVQIFSPNFRSNIAGSKALDVYAIMARDEKIYKFDDLQASIGPSLISGTMAVNMTKTKPAITAKLNAGKLPLDKLLGHDVDHKGTSRAQPMSSAKTENIRWSRKALNTDWMHGLNADMALTAEQFSYGPWALADAKIAVKLDDGTFLVSPLEGQLYEGSVNATAKAVSSTRPREPLTAQTALKLNNINLESFLRAFSGKELVRGKGVITLDTELATTGLSPAALIFSLQGKGEATGSNLAMEGFDLAKLSGLLAQPSSSMTENLNALLGASMAGGVTEFETMTAAYNVREGVVDFTDLTLTGPAAVVKGEGLVNLPLWAIDMTMTIQLAEPADAPPLRVVFKGPLDNPRKSFGQSAMESYFQSILKKELQNIIGKQLEDTGILPKRQPAPAPEPSASEELGGEGAITAEPLQPQPQPQPAPKQEIKPEDVFRGVLKGILEDAR